MDSINIVEILHQNMISRANEKLKDSTLDALIEAHTKASYYTLQEDLTKMHDLLMSNVENLDKKDTKYSNFETWKAYCEELKAGYSATFSIEKKIIHEEMLYYITISTSLDEKKSLRLAFFRDEDFSIMVDCYDIEGLPNDMCFLHHSDIHRIKHYFKLRKMVKQIVSGKIKEGKAYKLYLRQIKGRYFSSKLI